MLPGVARLNGHPKGEDREQRPSLGLRLYIDAAEGSDYANRIANAHPDLKGKYLGALLDDRREDEVRGS